MKTALVTGGAGFIGHAAVRALRAAHYDVVIAGTSVVSDALTPERIAGLPPVDVIIHCAGSSSVGASVADPSGERAKTIPPLLALLDRMLGSDTRLVLLSSAAVYGHASQVPTPESAPLAPVSPYGEHKRECEELCKEYGRVHGLSSVVVRLFSVYGPGLRKQLLWDACRKARANDLVFAGTGEEQRDWIHVDDAATLLLAAASHASAEVPVFNGGAGEGVRVRDVLGMLCTELGVQAPRFNQQTRPGDPPRYVADISRARAIGWAPTVPLSRGIAAYATWFREQE